MGGLQDHESSSVAFPRVIHVRSHTHLGRFVERPDGYRPDFSLTPVVDAAEALSTGLILDSCMMICFCVSRAESLVGMILLLTMIGELVEEGGRTSSLP